MSNTWVDRDPSWTEGGDRAASQPGWALTDDVDDHWTWRPDWACERACLWWYLTFEDDPELVEATEEIRRRLAEHPAADPVPARWLHLTVCEVGFADRLSDQQVDAVAGAVAEAVGREEAYLELGPVTTMPGAVVLAAAPLQPWRDLWLRVRLATEAAAPALSPVDEVFWPHVTLAYVNRPVPRAELLAGNGSRPLGIRTQPRTLTLAAVTRRDRHYQWTVRARAPLAGRCGD